MRPDLTAFAPRNVVAAVILVFCGCATVPLTYFTGSGAQYVVREPVAAALSKFSADVKKNQMSPGEACDFVRGHRESLALESGGFDSLQEVEAFELVEHRYCKLAKTFAAGAPPISSPATLDLNDSVLVSQILATRVPFRIRLLNGFSS